MNRLKKILLSFVLPFFCLLISVSYASEFVAGTEYFYPTSPSKSTTTLTKFSDDYTMSAGETIIKNYISDSSTYASDFYDLINSTMTFNNFDRYVVFSYDYSGNAQNYCFFWNSTINDIACFDGILGFSDHSEHLKFYCASGYTTTFQNIKVTGSGPEKLASGIYTNFTFFESNSSIKYCKRRGSTDYFVWDGVTYVYEVSSSDGPEEDTPSLPSNADIAKAVQAFYNSDYYKNNKDFEDFLVMYSYETGYFSFVGHNFESDLGQVIVPPDYKYEGYSYKQDWWKFFLRNISSEIASNFWNKYYWLYSTNDFGENIEYDGKGAIKDLVNIHFSTSSIIVYSTTDYPVVKIETDENGVLTPVEGTVPGNQYTYDETLDPTTNEYNPIKDYIPTDPTQSILGDVSFDEINKVFEENKNILDIKNASWLFSANNQLINYFIVFISFLIVLIIISRLLGG